jgi:dihydroorotase
MNPPIRGNKHRARLRQALKKGEIDIIGSDHAPHLLSEKKLTYPNSPSGMPGVQTLLPILLNEVSKKMISLHDVVKLTSFNPMNIFKVKNKGLIKEGYDADLTFVNLSKIRKIDNKLVQSKCKWTPFHGMKIKGWPIGTMINGTKVFWNDKVLGKPSGKPLNFN